MRVLFVSVDVVLKGNGRGKVDNGGFLSHRGTRKHPLYPRLHSVSGVNKQIAASDGRNILNGGVIGMSLHAGRQQQLNIGLIPRYFFGKIILREKRGHDAQGRFSALLGFLFLFPAFAGRKTKHYGNGKSGCRKTAKKFFHKNTPDIKR